MLIFPDRRPITIRREHALHWTRAEVVSCYGIEKNYTELRKKLYCSDFIFWTIVTIFYYNEHDRFWKNMCANTFCFSLYYNNNDINVYVMLIFTFTLRPINLIFCWRFFIIGCSDYHNLKAIRWSFQDNLFFGQKAIFRFCRINLCLKFKHFRVMTWG